MSGNASNFKLPKCIDRYMAALSKLYAQEGRRQLQEIIVNSQTRVHEEWSRDNWNGGTYGHALYLLGRVNTNRVICAILRTWKSPTHSTA